MVKLTLGGDSFNCSQLANEAMQKSECGRFFKSKKGLNRHRATCPVCSGKSQTISETESRSSEIQCLKEDIAELSKGVKNLERAYREVIQRMKIIDERLYRIEDRVDAFGVTKVIEQLAEQRNLSIGEVLQAVVRSFKDKKQDSLR